MPEKAFSKEIFTFLNEVLFFNGVRMQGLLLPQFFIVSILLSEAKHAKDITTLFYTVA